MRKYPVIEATLLNSTTVSNISNSSNEPPLPDSIVFSPNIKVRELIQLILSFVLRNDNLHSTNELAVSKYGILIIPATPKKMMTALSWMDDENNVSITLYDLQPYDILLLKQKEIIDGKYVSNNVTTTYDYSSKEGKKGMDLGDLQDQLPINIKLMITQTPTSNLSNTPSDNVNSSLPSSSPSRTSSISNNNTPSSSKMKSIQEDVTTLERGEKILVEAVNVGFLNDKMHQKTLVGRLSITNYQIIFTPSDPVSPFLVFFFKKTVVY